MVRRGKRCGEEREEMWRGEGRDVVRGGGKARCCVRGEAW